MNINSSYTGLTNINDVQSASLEKLGSALAINKASDDASGLAIADALGLQKTSLTQAIENMNSGIAMSNIAQSGISSQTEILENIKTETLKAMNGTTSQDGIKAIENQISKYIDQYEQISNSTTYNGESLLQTKGDITDDLSIVSDESIISMEKADTTSISDQLRSALSTFSNGRGGMSTMLDVVDQGSTNLASFAADFAAASNGMESTAKYSISTEKEIALAKSTILDIDYSKEVSDFSKTNIMAQIGMVVQSQSNAIQSRNISLLS